MISKKEPSSAPNSYYTLLLLVITSVGLMISTVTVFAKTKSDPLVSVGCSANPVSVHATTTCTATVTGNGSDSLNGEQMTFSASGLGSFTPANKKCDLVGNDTSANCSVFYVPSTIGSSTQTISASYPNGSNYNSASGNTFLSINKMTLTVIGITANSRVYNGNTSAVLSTTSAALSGLFLGDVVILNSSSISGLFSDKNVGTSKSVAISGLTISGADSGNYTLTQPSATANITTRPLTITATALSKVYDTTTNANVSLSSDKLGGDDIVVLGSASFIDANVGTGKTVNVTDISITGGADASNYSLSNTTANTTANITQESATIALDKSNLSRQYNKTSQEVAVLSTTPPSLPYVVTYNGLTTLPITAGSYDVVASITDPNYSGSDTATVVITQVNLTVGGATISNKIYDNTTDAAVSISGTTLNNLIAGDDVSLTNTAVGTFSDKNIGADKTVIVTGLSLTGADAGNYTLTQPSATASITAKEVTVSGITAGKEYDGNATATLNFLNVLLSGVIGENNVTLSTTSATGLFADKTASSSKPVAVSGLTLTGADSGNYSLTQPAVVADITTRFLNFTVIADNKVYDGTNTASTTLSGDKLSGDDVVASSTSTTFNDANVGTNKTVTVFGISIIGADALNYSLSSTTATTSASITVRPVTITADNKSKIYGASDPSLSHQTTSGSVASGDSVSGSLTRTAGENVGTYTITQGTLTLSANYDLIFVPGNFVIEVGSSNSTVIMLTTPGGDESPLTATIPTETNNSSTINGVSVTVTIPAGTVIFGPSTWDGSLSLPVVTTVFTSPTADVGSSITSLSAFDAGAGDVPLTFSKAVRIVFIGQSGKLVGWSRGGVFTKITDTCSADSQETANLLASGADCRIISGSDLVVWTKHFTTFITYSQQANPTEVINRSSNGMIVPSARAIEVVSNNSSVSKPALTNNSSGGGTLRSLAQLVRQTTTKKNNQIAGGNSSTTKSLAKNTKDIPLQASVANTKLPSVFQRIFNWLFRRK